MCNSLKMNLLIQTVFFYGFLVSNIMTSNTDINTFFPQIKGNLSRVNWAHAVNNNTYLVQVLADRNIMMLEADVVIGKVNAEDTDIPIMAHPPANTSDLSLESFLTQVDENNKKANITNGEGKGVKLDFKTIEAFEAAIAIIKNNNKGEYPFWINADILEGPVKPTALPVKPDQFLSQAKLFENSTLSLGWTTDITDALNKSYTNEQVEDMLGFITNNTVTNSVTFAVRALFTANSLDQMKTLVAHPNSTLTIWSSEGDKVNVEHLRNVIFGIGLDKIFIDVPQELKDKLRLDEPPQTGSGVKIMSAVGLLTTLFTILLCM